MSSEISKSASINQIQEWTALIEKCQSRPSSMSISKWCAVNGISRTNFYYKVRRVREACLEHVQDKIPAQQVVPVNPELLWQNNNSPKKPKKQQGLDICSKGFSIHVTEETHMPLLAAVLEVIRDVS